MIRSGVASATNRTRRMVLLYDVMRLNLVLNRSAESAQVVEAEDTRARIFSKWFKLSARK